MRRIAAGIYESLDGQHRIIRTEWEGPRGGKLHFWEHATPDRYAGWVLDGYGGERTLAKARAQLEHRP
jgi:hypothetical protein